MYLKLGKPYIDLINYLQSFSPLCVKKKKKNENWDLSTPFKYTAGRPHFKRKQTILEIKRCL